MLISIDHGNKQVKTIHHAPFTSGLVCSEVRPFGGETLTYQGRYYTLTDQRIPYRRDKTEDAASSSYAIAKSVSTKKRSSSVLSRRYGIRWSVSV